MKTFNEYVAETTAPIIMDAVRMQKYESAFVLHASKRESVPCAATRAFLLLRTR